MRKNLRFGCSLSWLFLIATHRCGVLTKTVVGSKDTVEAGEVDPWFPDQGGQPSNDVEWVKDDMGSAGPVWCLERIEHVFFTGQSQAFARYCRARDVPAQPLQLSPLVCLRCDTGMQREGLTAGVGTDSDAQRNGIAHQVVQVGFIGIFELQLAVLKIPHQQTFALQVSADPLADHLHESFQRSGGWRWEAAKHALFAFDDVHRTNADGEPIGMD